MGAIPGAVDGARHPGLRAPILVILGASLGGIGALTVTALLLHLPLADFVLAGLGFGLGAVIIVLIALGSALTFFAPRDEPGA
jgi:hypothetical protein